jgi:hypothetical protein
MTLSRINGSLFLERVFGASLPEFALNLHGID